MLEKQAKKIYLGVGSNLRDKKKNIEFAKFLLQQNKKFRIVKTSSFYKTKSYIYLQQYKILHKNMQTYIENVKFYIKI